MTYTATMAPKPQQLEALQQANKIRLARAELKRQIAQGRRSAASVIVDSPNEASSWAVRDLLVSQRRWGSQRCRKFLAELEIPERKQIGTLTPRQRNALATRLEACTPRVLELPPRESAPERPREMTRPEPEYAAPPTRPAPGYAASPAREPEYASAEAADEFAPAARELELAPA